MSVSPKSGISHLHLAPESSLRRYEAFVRISEVLTACRQPEEFAKSLADLLSESLSFDHLDVVFLKENSPEIEWHAWGKGSLGLPDLSSEDLLTWNVYGTSEPLHIPDWNSDTRFDRIRQFLAEKGVGLGSVVRVPLRVIDRHLGTLGLASAHGVTYQIEDVEFLRLVARIVASAIGACVNLKRAQAAQTRLQLLLKSEVRPDWIASNAFEPAGDRPSNLVGTVLLHEVEPFDDHAMLIREAARQSPDSARNEYTWLRVYKELRQ